MTDSVDLNDRHSAPEGRKKGATQLILLTSLIAALCFIAYLLLFNQKTSDAKAAERQQKKAASQLHTSNSTFEMPVFKKPELAKPEALPVTETIVVAEPEPMFTLDPLPKPEPLVVPKALPEQLPKTEVIVKHEAPTERPMTDEERRLGGGVSGSKGLSTLASTEHRSTSQNATFFGAGSDASGIRSRRRQVLAEDSVYESEYEHLGASTQALSPPVDSELNASDIERLDQLASLYRVSEKPRRLPAYKASTVSGSSYEPLESSRSERSYSGSDVSSEQGKPKLNFQPINTAAKNRSSRQGGIDLSSTVVAGAEARKIKLDYLLKRGTYIGCVLKTRIVSDQAGFISCGTTEDIYSADGSTLLLPRGSDVLGEYKPKSLSNGKVRLQAVWDAVTTPDGVRVNLGSPSTGRLGAAGIGGHVNNHYGKKVGIPILLSLFRTAIDYRTRNFSGESGEYKSTGANAADDVLADQMAEYEEIRPTLTKQQGSTIGIMVARDVSFEKVLTGSR